MQESEHMFVEYRPAVTSPRIVTAGRLINWKSKCADRRELYALGRPEFQHGGGGTSLNASIAGFVDALIQEIRFKRERS